MRFAKRLDRHAVPQWRDRYVDYKGLKKIINREKRTVLPEAERGLYNPNSMEQGPFWEKLRSCIEQVNDFYLQNMEQNSGMLTRLVNQCIILGLLNRFELQNARVSVMLSELRRMKSFYDSNTELLAADRPYSEDIQGALPLGSKKRKSALAILKDSFQEFHRGLQLLSDFCALNFEAVSKIVKKHDKAFGTEQRSRYLESIRETPFTCHTDLLECMKQCEAVYSEAFEGGNRHTAMKKLRVPKEEPPHFSIFSLGFFVGMALPLVLLVVLWLSVTPGTAFVQINSIFIVFRMVGLSVWLAWMWGLDMAVWSRFRVDYSFIFQFDPRNHLPYQSMFKFAAIFTAIWLSFIVLYLIGCYPPTQIEDFRDVPQQIWPLLLVVLSLVAILGYQIKSGMWLLRALFRIVCAPLFKIVFSDFFMADQLQSLSIAMYDLEFTVCYFSYDAWTDGTKCFDINKGTFGGPALLSLWIIAATANTAYSYAWDLTQDWGLVVRGSKNWLLRDNLQYRHKWIYYVCMALNLVLRMCWTLTISPEFFKIGRRMSTDAFTTILSILEIARRGMWNIIRVEKEHLENCTHHTATRNIRLPLDTSSTPSSGFGTPGSPTGVLAAPGSPICLTRQSSLIEEPVPAEQLIEQQPREQEVPMPQTRTAAEALGIEMTVVSVSPTTESVDVATLDPPTAPKHET
eukprot:m51a1_g4538 hypothetical protein (685) ;mRNA; r:40024-43008